ncbi:MAG TPA: extracellular solute-binding protein [Candidatus Binatia bacterium]|nr:extracellular solute-binding protein [Candidatus Binatia bacterium]
MRRIGLISLVFSALLFSAAFATAQSKPEEWDRIVEAAKKEGKVVASIPPSPELRKLMEITFARRYGIGVEFVPARGGAIIQRMVSEAKSGVQYFDLHIGGTESIITGLLPENVLEPVEPYFVLPEVKDAKQWWGGHIWADHAKKYVYNFVAYQTVSLWSNPTEYKPSQFKSFDDLLDPRLRGRIGISDPRTPGSGSSMWSYMNYIKGEEYLKKFVAQKLFVTRDLRLLADQLAKGKIAVTSGIGYSEFLPFIKANLPVAPLPVPKEGLYVSGGYGHLTILKHPPHPNAAKVFINWLLSRDGQEIFSRAMGVGSRRLDIDTKWLREYGVIAAKDFLTVDQFYKYENQSEEKIYKIREPGAAVARRLLGT